MSSNNTTVQVTEHQTQITQADGTQMTVAQGGITVVLPNQDGGSSTDSNTLSIDATSPVTSAIRLDKPFSQATITVPDTDTSTDDIVVNLDAVARNTSITLINNSSIQRNLVIQSIAYLANGTLAGDVWQYIVIVQPKQVFSQAFACSAEIVIPVSNPTTVSILPPNLAPTYIQIVQPQSPDGSYNIDNGLTFKVGLPAGVEDGQTIYVSPSNTNYDLQSADLQAGFALVPININQIGQGTTEYSGYVIINNDAGGTPLAYSFTLVRG